MTTTPDTLDAQRYFASIDADTERLLAVAAARPDAAIPRCRGWTVDDVVTHVAHVYEHKVAVMAGNGWPDPWPPADEAERAAEPSLDRLAEAKAALFAEFAAHELADETTTFSADDRTIGFWVRRMALEVAVHRYDVEQAAGQPSPIPDDIALDGIDEVLRVMLAGPWWDGRVEAEHPVEVVVAVAAAGRWWPCDVRRHRVSVGGDIGVAPAVTISGAPMPLFLWLWGRAADDDVRFAGDAAVAAEFRARLVECTG